ncbi:MAG: recombinase family protein [Clostridia bacterium]|nr:recombinase family protein [Clostridia bacterium]
MQDLNYNFPPTYFKVGIYTRLSREDEKEKESESIDTQKKLLINYIKSQGWTLFKIYVDDGFTGTNFNRPDFKKLINDIEASNVNLVITKDLSRLGRDYIETGYYLEKYFPLKNVRYIALNDGIDTFDNNNTNNDMTPFKSVFNDMYAKDISKKVRSSLLTKAASGQNIKSFLPYGYRKDENDKNIILVDYEVSPIVQKIFEMYYKGSNKTEICKYLNTNKILTPLAYKRKTTNYFNPNNKTNLWSTTMISKILRDRIYTGDLVQHKYSKLNYKTKKVINVPKNQYIIIKNNHEPIIDRNIFNSVQIILDKKSNEWNYTASKLHLLQGLVLCKKCKSKITYNKNHGKDFRCVCSSYKRNGSKFCSNIHLREDALINSVIASLRENIGNFLKYDELEYIFLNKQANNKKLDYLYSKINEKDNLIQSLYEDKVKGIVTEELFIRLLKQYEEDKRKLVKLIQKEKEINKNEVNKDDLIFNTKKILEFKENKIDRNLILKLIDKIEIDDDSIDIYYKFKAI